MSNIDLNSNQLFTIGYQFEDRVTEIKDFFTCIKKYQINSIIDIRTIPLSEKKSNYDRGILQKLCESNNIFYHWVGKQLGLNYSGDITSKHTCLRNKEMRNYADYMATDKFKIAVSQLINLISINTPVLFTDPSLPNGCIRQLLSDYLSLQGIQVTHIISESNTFEHILHQNARRESIELIYDNVK